jgi:ABC-type glutathione transport system ATPase component
MPNRLLEVKDATISFGNNRWGKAFKAVDSISFCIDAGKTMGLVGESGSGKTTIGRAILGLAPLSAGKITFDGREIQELRRSERRKLAGEIQAVFQDPYSSLNPNMTVEEVLSEPLEVAGSNRSDARMRIRQLLEQVALPRDSGQRLPREFSGGQRQRVAIARALALSPRLIICDEPVSALDLSTQARILDLLIDIQENTGVSYLFISHDLSVIRYISHDVTVVNQGKIVETGEGEEVTTRPQENYTKRLLMAAPAPDPVRQAARRLERRALQQ